MMRGLWRNFVTGLLVILPAVLTLLILQVLLGWAVRWVINPLAKLIDPWVAPGWATGLARLAIAVGFILAVALLGFGTRILLFRRLLNFGEELLRRLPMVGKIYGTIREIADAFGGRRQRAFTRVVLLEWPRKGLYAIGFVTSEGQGEVQAKIPEGVVNVFVPTTPNPTSGYLILASQEALIPLQISVEEGMKLVISGGMVGPWLKSAAGATGPTSAAPAPSGATGPSGSAPGAAGATDPSSIVGYSGPTGPSGPTGTSHFLGPLPRGFPKPR